MLIAVVFVSFGVLIGASAAANPSRASQTEVEFSGQQIAAHQLEGRALQNNESVEQYLSNQAALGRNLDVRRVNASDVGDNTIVWEDGVSVDRVRVVADDEDHAVGLLQHETGDEAVAPSLPPGMGMSSLVGMKNLRLIGGICTTVSSYADQATSCYQKYKATADTSSVYDYYDYNRWGNGDPRSGARITRAEIQSRPWTGMKDGKIAGVIDFYPHGGSSVCQQVASATGGINLGYMGTGINFSATFPVYNCEQQDVSTNATRPSMMAAWYATGSGSTVTKATQFNMVIKTWQGEEAVMADYIWCKFTHADGWTHATGWHDTGW
jgi:hypothetical protein